MMRVMEPRRRLLDTLVVLLLVHMMFPEAAAHKDGKHELYKDPKQTVAVRVKDLLGRMTLDEKLGQMTQIEMTIANTSVVTKYYIGSILSGGGSSPGPKATVKQWTNMTDYFQSGALKTRLSIPEIYGIDAVHGHNTVYGATVFPHNVGLGCTRDPALIEKIGVVTALEVRATGIPYVFAPCIAVCRDPRWGRCYESYSEDPDVVSSMTSIIDGLQGKKPHGWDGPYVQKSTRKVAACAKHFVGDGGTTNGTDEGNTEVSYKELVDIHMKAYPHAIARGVATIMASYNSWNGFKMHANKFLLTDVLKGQLGFKGFIISDWQGIDRISTPWGVNYTYSTELALNAGIDMVMVPYNYTGFITVAKQLIAEKKVPMSRIDDAVSRILRVKFQMGLFEKPFADKSLSKLMGTSSHRKLARQAVRKSLVLLKNGKSSKPLLPLNKYARKILVAGAHANDIGLQCGGWTISWQGMPGNITKGTTILEGIKQTVDSNTKVVYKANPKKGDAKEKGYQYAIIVVGEQPYAEFEGDNLNLTLPAPYPNMIKDTCYHVQCVVVIISGRPLVIEPYVSDIDALVAAWLPGTEGTGIADVLFGKYDFQGKLSRTWFKRVDQLPMNVGDKDYDPLYPFGFGLKMGVSHD